MPRGVPSKGFRMTKNRMKGGFDLSSVVANKATANVPQVPMKVETDEEIISRLREKFSVLKLMADATVHGHNRSFVVSGPPGVGKSFLIDKTTVDAEASHGIISTTIKGFVRPTGLYKVLYEYRHKNSVVVFDDADSIFFDDASLNLLKTACDTTKTRKLSWLAETNMELSGGEKLPTSFEFEGSVIFITNLDFDHLIGRGHRLTPHLEALISRSHYLDLALKTRRDCYLRIKQVVEDGMLKDQGVDAFTSQVILGFIETNLEKLREVSLRMVIKLATLMQINKAGWQAIARSTCFKNAR